MWCTYHDCYVTICDLNEGSPSGKIGCRFKNGQHQYIPAIYLVEKNPNEKPSAYQQFIQDLKNDPDFVAFKKKAVDHIAGFSYGVVIARSNRFIIEKPLLLTQ